LAAVANATRARPATPAEVRRHTGFAVGGVPPFGHASNLRCFLDDALLSQPIVWAAAGTPTHVFSASPAALGLAASARIATLREPHVG
jgi:prolyl-tRNA editing enzyme YbaK/EbsC (Cys-tRNA(Pro) deacylase)